MSEKMTGCGGEAQMCDSRPVMGKPEPVVVTEAVGLAPMEIETEAAEVKDHVRVEKPERVTAQPLGNNPVPVAQPAVSDKIDGHKDQTKPRNVVVVLALPAAGVQNKERLKSRRTVAAKFKVVKDKSVAETVTKLDGIKLEFDNGGPSAETKVKPQDNANGVGNEQTATDELAGTEEEREAFVKEVEAFHRANKLKFRHPKFYKENLNLLKLWRAVHNLGGYVQVSNHKLWKHVGELFNPPKTCTAVSWTFRNYYEKALLNYEMYKIHGVVPAKSLPAFVQPISAIPAVPISTHAPGSSGVTVAAAAHAMKSYHPIIKVPISTQFPRSNAADIVREARRHSL